MTPFEIVEPASLREAIGLLDPEDPSVRPAAGATALMLMMKMGLLRPRRLVSLRSVERKFSGVDAGPDGGLRVGALTPLSVVERAPVVRRDFPVIAQTLRTLSNVRVRNVATVGGHLAHADPHMDLPPVLAVLGASVTVTGPSGSRTVLVEKLYTGYLETVLKPDELIVELIVPPQGGHRAAYLKCTTRSADDWPALGVAAALDADGAAVREASIVISAATDRPIRLAAAESVLLGGIDDAKISRAGEAAAEEAPVIADVGGSAAYKRQLVRVYVERAVRNALGMARQRMPGHS
jgi:aerobic carbon-monoxide dehydrogenase medium subunit